MNKILVWLIRIVVVVVIGFAIWQFGIPLYNKYTSKKIKDVFVPTVKVKQGPFLVSFSERGTLEAINTITVQSPINGKIISIVKDGDVIKEGDLIAVLDSGDLKNQARSRSMELENVKREVERAEAEFEIFKEQNKTDLALLESDLDFNKTELDRAKKDLEKKERLLKEKLIAGTEVESAELAVKSRELTVTKGEMQYELKQKDIESREKQREADIKNIQFRVNIVTEQFDDAEFNVKNTNILSPSSGMIVLGEMWTGNGNRKYQNGDNVSMNSNICTIPDLNNMKVMVKVVEANVSKLQKGTSVNLTIDAIKGKKYRGKIEEISTLAKEDQFWESGAVPGKKTFLITVYVTEKDPKNFRPGMTVESEFIIKNLGVATYLPIESVFERDGSTWVFLKKGRKFEKTAVTVGEFNDNFVQIKSGVKLGDTVALKDPALVATEANNKTDDKDTSKKAPLPNGDKK